MNDVITLDGRAKRNILIAMCTALMAVQASVSGLNVAQGQLAVDLGISQGTILWIINAYTLALASLLMPVGAIGDRFGRKPVLVTGLTVFLAASALAGFAQSGVVMIAARALAGVGAAMIMPVTLSVITSTFPPDERGRAIGIWAGVAGSGGLVGLLMSAFMVDFANWRWLFALPAALVAFALVLSLKVVPNSREHSAHPFDIIGSITSAVAIGGLVLGIHEGPERSWSDPITLTGLIIGGLALVAFIAWELRNREPLLDVRAFTDRSLATGSFTLLLLFGTMFGIFLVLFPFFQAVLGWSALRSAAAMLPLAAMMMPLSTLAPKVNQRIGTRATIMTGLTAVAAGLVILATLASVDGGYLSVLPGLLVIG
ncbi:MAG: MFS transporter, partial [Ilumatobacteraceae bacterium]